MFVVFLVGNGGVTLTVTVAVTAAAPPVVHHLCSQGAAHLGYQHQCHMTGTKSQEYTRQT